MIKYTNAVEVPSWNVRNFSPFKSIQYSPNEVEQRGLAQNNNNLMNYIFGRYYLMHWWETKYREVTTQYPFEELTDIYKTPLFLVGNIFQPNRNFENFPGFTKKVKNISYQLSILEKER